MTKHAYPFLIPEYTPIEPSEQHRALLAQFDPLEARFYAVDGFAYSFIGDEDAPRIRITCHYQYDVDQIDAYIQSCNLQESFQVTRSDGETLFSSATLQKTYKLKLTALSLSTWVPVDPIVQQYAPIRAEFVRQIGIILEREDVESNEIISQVEQELDRIALKVAHSSSLRPKDFFDIIGTTLGREWKITQELMLKKYFAGKYDNKMQPDRQEIDEQRTRYRKLIIQGVFDEIPDIYPDVDRDDEKVQRHRQGIRVSLLLLEAYKVIAKALLTTKSQQHASASHRINHILSTWWPSM